MFFQVALIGFGGVFGIYFGPVNGIYLVLTICHISAFGKVFHELHERFLRRRCSQFIPLFFDEQKALHLLFNLLTKSRFRIFVEESLIFARLLTSVKGGVSLLHGLLLLHAVVEVITAGCHT